MDFEVRESQYHTDYKVLEPVPECNCQPKITTYNGTVKLEVPT
jgi:hypothetical protein